MIDNPYWTALKDRVTSEHPLLGGHPVVDALGDYRHSDWPSSYLSRYTFVEQYSWTIPDPQSLMFVTHHSAGSIIDPIAGTGYWCYLLHQLDVDCLAFDIHPPEPTTGANLYHPKQRTWHHVQQADAADAVTDTNHTLLLSWPPRDDTAHRALKTYTGDRIIYIGEGPESCADEAFFTDLTTTFNDIAGHIPVRWGGLHDSIIVYDRT